MSIDPDRFASQLACLGVRYVVGVPDSLMRSPLEALARTFGPGRYAVAVNEGNAIALAAGHHLATGHVPLVYFQNSGLGNAINPLLSFADPDVYGVPMLLMIGWRGEPGRPDEPQHVVQGRVTLSLLSQLGLPFRLLDGRGDAASDAVRWAVTEARARNGPVALVVRAGAFSQVQPAGVPPDATRGRPSWRREDAIAVALDVIDEPAIVVATTGMTGREVFALRKRRRESGELDLLVVGSMGHASAIALGLASERPEWQVICFDGDGAALMHLGAFAAIGASDAKRFRHVLIDNGVHDSVGGQPTAAPSINFGAVARACGYRCVMPPVETAASLGDAIRTALRCDGPAFVQARVTPGADAMVGRPDRPLVTAKRALMRALGAVAATES